MSEPDAPLDRPYLTTKEVAELLRVKERKVYDLAAAGEIPHRRITGKLLFPRSEILQWIEGEGTAPAMPGPRPAVLAGSHDPFLDWAVRASDSGLATLYDGSRAGLTDFIEGRAALAGLHLPSDAGWNVPVLEAAGLRDAVLIGWARRARGLILSEDLAKSVRGIADLAGRRVVMRQPGAGAAEVLQGLLAEAGLSASDFSGVPELARTESDAAAAVADGDADAALGLAAMAKRFSLPFVPLLEEGFDLLVDRRAYFTPPVQKLLAFVASEAAQSKAAAMGGYDLSALGDVRWLSP